jgi:hypothetical protein
MGLSSQWPRLSKEPREGCGAVVRGAVVRGAEHHDEIEEHRTYRSPIFLLYILNVFLNLTRQVN